MRDKCVLCIVRVASFLSALGPVPFAIQGGGTHPKQFSKCVVSKWRVLCTVPVVLPPVVHKADCSPTARELSLALQIPPDLAAPWWPSSSAPPLLPHLFHSWLIYPEILVVLQSEQLSGDCVLFEPHFLALCSVENNFSYLGIRGPSALYAKGCCTTSWPSSEFQHRLGLVISLP